MSAHGKFVPDPDWPTIVELAIERWGQPNRKLSSRDDIRFGNNGSKSVEPSTNTWFDHEANDGGGYVEMHLATRGELPKSKKKPNDKLPLWQDIATTYDYPDADGNLILQVVRTLSGEPRFRQRRPDDRGGWIWSVKDIPGHNQLLYRLPGLRSSGDAAVWITEGEKDADRLHDEGLIATTNIGGAGKWRHECAVEFRGKHCVVLQDNDKAGRDHVATVARSLKGIAASVKVLLLPGLPEKGDVSNWLDDVGTSEDLERLGREAQEYRLSAADPADHQLPQIAWIDERLSDWADRTLPPRLWAVEDWILREQVTGIYGVGGINKTDFLIMLLLAKSKGLPFLGYMLEPGPVYGLFCEDTREEIIRRATRIIAHWGFKSLASFPDFHFASLVGVNGKEFVTFDNGSMTTTDALRHFDRRIMETGAHLATLDTLPHFYGGNEIVRRDVTRFITQLDAISIARGCGIVFTAHPSQRGKQTGSLDSGSTGWEGGVRARLTLHDPGPEARDEDEVAPQIDSYRRILTRAKAN